MTRDDIRALYDKHMRINYTYGGARTQRTAHTVRFIDEVSGRSTILYSALTADNADAVIAEEQAFFGGLGHTLEWKWYDYDTPANLLTRLQAHGFTPDDDEAILVLDIDNAPEDLLRPIAHDVRHLTNPADIPHVVATVLDPVHKPIPGIAARIVAQMHEDPNSLAFFAAYVADEPVCAAWSTRNAGSPFAGLWGGGTLPAHRGKGVYTAVVAARLQHLKRQGVRFLNVDASPMSRPILEKRGFQLIAMSRPCNWSPNS